jgi:hypothetical protein
VREHFRAGARATADGRLWPRPDVVRLRAGDGVLVLHDVPHAATRCCAELGAATRYQVALWAASFSDHLHRHVLSHSYDRVYL